MVAAPEYTVETQAKFPPAMAAIHNFIRIHDPDDINREAEKEAERCPPCRQPGNLGGDISRREIRRATKRRDDIAIAMWEQYVAYRAGRDGN
jgi:hypothetical protein